MELKDLKWYTDRVGKVVFRNKTSCKCGVCDDVYERGVLIQDSEHANYLFDIVGAYNIDGSPLEYFDTIEERNEFELTLNN